MGIRGRARPCAQLVVSVVLTAGLAVSVAGPATAVAAPGAVARASSVKVTPAMRKAIAKAIAKYVRTHRSQLKGAMGAQGPAGPATGPAGGALSGSYPNPSLHVSGGDASAGSCASGEALTSLSSAAVLTCAPFGSGNGTITGVSPGAGLSGGGSSGNVSLSLLSGYQLPQTCTSGQLVEWNGSGWDCSPAAWSLTGNSGTTSSDFVGTTDKTPLNLDVNGIQGLELKPGSDSNNASSPNLIGGYSGNTINPGVSGATIGGGGTAASGAQNIVSGDFGTVGGGDGNSATSHATVPGGEENGANGDASTAFGFLNTAWGSYSTAFGESNSVNGTASTAMGIANNSGVTPSGNYSTAIGYDNSTPGTTSFAEGGLNTASGENSVAMGDTNSTGTNAEASFALGRNASSTNSNSFVWSDGVQGSNGLDFADTGPEQFDALAEGGFNMQLSVPGATYTGCKLTSSSGWSCTSDANAKHDFAGVSDQQVLRELARMPIRSWSYKIDPTGTRHVGPTAQAFKRAFGFGNDPRSISLLDEGGVALASVKGLYQLVTRQQAVERRQQAQISELQREVGKLLKRTR